MSQPLAETQTLAEIAREAGRLLLDHYARPHEPREKADRSPVTAADEAAEALILDRLARVWPHVPVISEEAFAAGQAPGAAPRFFLVDPMDGTREFLNRNGEFTVNIALVEDGRPVSGVVYAPAQDRLFAGDAAGAFESHELPQNTPRWREIAARAPEPGALVALKSRSHGGRMTDEYLAHYPIARFVVAGSSLKFGLIAAGEADLYPRHGRTMAWDTAAGQAVLEAAGGSVRDLHGRPLSYGRDGFENPFFVARGRD